eukprot:CAMPEP_0113952806 /NCGR_PEP_ID=MMETSP1339-20121228/90628_1 /TAXON_ID=94617 /ORGANISM="Fibrocapsa japonica" /LENGTH=403 /DNA_ID=CAMNT_0000961471 /DNA_START=206 /DNA_END=1418 /DNA_ORIENTATION=- /assembly_acc=CAM_ASM_000762
MSNEAVAVIGGGISGLTCARELSKLGISAVVFDKAKKEVGGRCSTRKFRNDGRELVFDHSAQFIAVSDDSSPVFKELVAEMESAGVITPWDSSVVGTLQAGGRFQASSAGSGTVYYKAPGGMGEVPKFLAEQCQVERPVWVSKIRRNRNNNSWGAWHYKEFVGNYGHVVISHNGKCAARLMSSAGKECDLLYKQLNARFGATVKYDTPRFMQLNSLWVLCAHFDQDIQTPAKFEGAFVKGIRDLSWVSNNSAKLGSTGSGSSWTIISSPTFGQKFKCPQENIPPEHAEMVTEKLLSAFAVAAGLPQGSLEPSFSFVQLWGAANPISVSDVPSNTPFIYQNDVRVGICGDWLMSPSIESAVCSGYALAHHIGAVMNESIDPNASDVGIQSGFKKLQVTSPIASK